ncbi:MAG: hypothetical protein O6837_14260, partial [Deltaproteobacteria bacterium]|nr:hypothetical protein [Deltaproteobacteria bacterium]
MSKNVLLSFASLSLTLLCLEIILRLYPTTDIQTNNPYQYTKTIGKWAFLVPHHSFTHVYPVEFDSRGYYAKTGGVVDYHSNQ